MLQSRPNDHYEDHVFPSDSMIVGGEIFYNNCLLIGLKLWDDQLKILVSVGLIDEPRHIGYLSIVGFDRIKFNLNENERIVGVRSKRSEIKWA